MKKFLIRTGLFILLFFIIVELFSRIVIDPLYFYSIDSYNVKLVHPKITEVYKFKETKHVDYLFIGTSRVPATINPALIMSLDSGKIAVVAGRGYMTAGIHYQALKNRVSKYPDYLKGAKVFIEYPGYDVYTDPFTEDKLKVSEPLLKSDKAMPYLLLPHLNLHSYFAFLRESKNSLPVKIKLSLEYFISSFRTIDFIKEKFARLDNKYLFKDTKQMLVSEGGIRNDNIDNARELAIDYAKFQIQRIENNPLMTIDQLNKSSLAYMYDLIVKNGGKLYLYKMPLFSVQEDVYGIPKAIKNRQVFEQWISDKGIEVLDMDGFEFSDTDFPDAWHLSEARRDEFTRHIFSEIKEICYKRGELTKP